MSEGNRQHTCKGRGAEAGRIEKPEGLISGIIVIG